jgi:oligopeptidase A
LRAASGHVDTGEPLPLEITGKLLARRRHMAATGMLRQLYFAQLDMALHRTENAGADPLVVPRRIAARYSLLPPLGEDRFLCSFMHIFSGGYAAGYYSYMWANVMAADAFGAFEEAGLDDAAAVRRTGQRFRDTVLARGGSQHAAAVYKDFRGRAPTPDALMRQYGLTHQ